MATAPDSSLHMSSADLIKKEPLDYGGFGDVYLCYHATLGQVVMKTLYTGSLRSEESKRSLLEEGNIMASLNHERVVKLLGVIMEDRDCSLVMELIPRGNLLVMLETVSVSVSIKGRIILEILEGMVYLTERCILHKDIKPENILVDKDFHIKIADLGLSTCQTWSKLTKEESRRKSRAGQSAGTSGAGTLSYMAPEHLESIHTASTEKSDVYSFAIVVWFILTGQEPYANARSEDHLTQCVRKGDRPAEDLIPPDTPKEMIQLMKNCWNPCPQQRPTFKEGYSCFLPFYKNKLEPCVEEDLIHLRQIYEGPDDLVEKMKSLSMTNDCFPTDGPASLVSSDRNVSVPVEASIEDLHVIHYEPVQTDAVSVTAPSALDEKLHRELQYHKHGSYNWDAQLHPGNIVRPASNPFLQNPCGTSYNAVRQPEPDRSSVHSWTKAEPVQPTSQDEPLYHPLSSCYGSMNSATSGAEGLSMSSSSPSLQDFNQQPPHSSFNRQYSLPIYPVSDTSAPDMAPGRHFSPSMSVPPQDPGSVFIQNARGVMIGNHNMITIKGYGNHSSEASSSNSRIREGIQKYEHCLVTEEHLGVLRLHIGSRWKRCARLLGLTDVEIDTIEHDYGRDGLPEMVHKMLERWKMKEGSLECTIGKLYQALAGNIAVEAIQKILHICASSAPST